MAERKRFPLSPVESLSNAVAVILVITLPYFTDNNGQGFQAYAAEDLNIRPVASERLIFNADTHPLVFENGVIKVVPFIEPAVTEETGGGGEATVKSPEEIMQAEWAKVQKKMAENPNRFSEQDLIDLGIYFPVYWEAAKKYDLPWYLFPPTHQDESNVSLNPDAFTGFNGYKNGFQRNPYYYPESYVDEAVSGAPEYLFELETRHPSDVREAYFFARKIKDDGGYWGHEGDWAIVDALDAYSARGPAQSRFYRYTRLKEIFG